MIPGFEEFTADLNQKEIDFLVPEVVRSLKRKIGKDLAVKNSDIRKGLAIFPTTKHFVVKEDKVRKLIQYIRVHGLVPRIAASSKGYYVCNDDVEFRAYVDAFGSRIRSMTFTYDAMEWQLKSN